jgi:hypothetical protein
MSWEESALVLLLVTGIGAWLWIILGFLLALYGSKTNNYKAIFWWIDFWK